MRKFTVMQKLFYLLFHLLFTIYKAVDENLNKLLQLCHEFYPVNKTNFPKIEKFPKHVTVLLGCEEPSYVDITKLILWCLAARITFVTFYDHTGKLKKNEDKLHSLVRQRMNQSDHLIWHTHPDMVHKNGFKGRTVHVKVLSLEDGRAAIADAARTLARSGCDSITVESLDERLKKRFEFPDPDLGVCCGKTFSLYGYPPWQIGVTEVLSIESHHKIKFEAFVDLLCRFSKCQQRYGK